MLSLSNELFKMFSKYLSDDVSIDCFRDYMVGLRVDKYKLLADADRLFLNEFEGRYAEFGDFGGDESLLKAALVSYVQSDEAAAVSNRSYLLSVSSVAGSAGSFSMSFGAPAASGNFTAVAVGLAHA
jgi:hypothetical protein